MYPYEYDLILRPDINTRGHTQWFFFSIANTRAGCRYKLNLINLLKEDSLYNDGMQVAGGCSNGGGGFSRSWRGGGSHVLFIKRSEVVARLWDTSGGHGPGAARLIAKKRSTVRGCSELLQRQLTVLRRGRRGSCAKWLKAS